ncbi:MAG: hypothetical protein LBB90_05195 [Tannerella sp.]|jgi:hypothetical protein|nr:hypothetical protein [Tannerella sp.]
MLILSFAGPSVFAQESPFRYSGQLSGWAQYAPDISPESWLGGRYLPQANFRVPLEKERLFDFELSATIFGDAGLSSFEDITASGKIKPYRAWARYSTERLEMRLGLQKINFGSAQMFRPLMWFDQLDPRDPLQLTDGVWGVLGRYYFQNNANIWLWALYGNRNTKGGELFPTQKHSPEGGGRVQLPVPSGETALSYHYRTARTGVLQTGEHRAGLDVRLDIVVGLWFEASWTKLTKDLDLYTNQEMMTLGSDYTFGIGNGLTATFEQLLYSSDRKAFDFDHAATFSGLSLAYPLGMLDNLSSITCYDWKNRNMYFFLNWKRQLNHLTFYLMGYWNPENYILPGQSTDGNRFAGKGLQVMVVWSH